MVDLDALNRAELIRLILDQQAQIDQLLRKQVDELLRTAKGSASAVLQRKAEGASKTSGAEAGTGNFQPPLRATGNQHARSKFPFWKDSAPFAAENWKLGSRKRYR